MDKFVKWILGTVGFMAKMLNPNGIAMQIVKRIMAVIRKVQATGKSGADKRALAMVLLLTELPEIIEMAVALMKHEDSCPGDKDCDGVPDAQDKCPEDPKCQ